MADPIDDFLSSGGQSPVLTQNAPTQTSGDPIDDWLNSGGGHAPQQSRKPPATFEPFVQNPTARQSDWERMHNPTAPDIAADRLIGGGVRGVIAGYKGLADLFSGKGQDKAIEDIEHTTGDVLKPSSTPGELTSKAIESPWNPMNWPDLAGKKIGDISAENNAPPAVSTALRVAPDAIAMLLGMRQGSSEGAAEWDRPVEGVSTEEPVLATADVPMPKELQSDPELSVEPNAPRQYPSEHPEARSTPFDEEAPTASPGSALSEAEQARRARVLSEVGLENGYRRSAVTGDSLEAATDYQLSKLNTEPGHFAKNLLDNEREALRGYSEDTVSKTGGRTGDTQTDTIARGRSVTDALDALEESYNGRIRKLYQAADERAKGTPTDLGGFNDVLKDDSLMTNQDRVGLRSGLNAYIKKLGLADENGNVTASVQQAETLRKYLNDEWSPQNSKLVSKLKDALDDDVTQAAGTDIYKEARALRAEKGATVDNPKGINRIMSSEGPEGINRTVPTDKIMQNLETMDPAQLSHIMDTLRGMKGDLAEQGQKALADIQAHFAERARSIGDSQEVQWNSKGLNQYLRNNSERLGIVFRDKPEVLKRLYTANEAGKILRFNPGYPGAAAQAINIGKAGTVPNYLHRGITMGGSAIGGALTGTPLGATAGGVVGDLLGGKAAKAAADRAAMKAAQSRAVNP